jgi:ElaB/YqjD/DUF883 family membrane-anchored ribosome-binding protein
MSIEQLRLKTIEQSITHIQLSLKDLTGAINQLLQEPQVRPLAKRVDTVKQQIAEELERIRYVIEQGSKPVSQAELDLGQKVQDALSEISQI